MGKCPNCGGTIIGDGSTEVFHCENTELEDICDKEPDSGVIYCKIIDCSTCKWYLEPWVPLNDNPNDDSFYSACLACNRNTFSHWEPKDNVKKDGEKCEQ